MARAMVILMADDDEGSSIRLASDSYNYVLEREFYSVFVRRLKRGSEESPL